MINAQANFDSDFKKKKVEIKKLNDEFKKYKKETKLLIEEKNLLIKDYEDRVSKLTEIKQQQVTMINKEKEDLENELLISKNQLKILNLRENFYKNKTEKLLIQKEFLVKQIDNNLETMNNEYAKLQDQETQKDFMISVKKSNKNIQEVYHLNINSLKYFKEVIDFMRLNEFMSMNKILTVDEEKEIEREAERERGIYVHIEKDTYRSDVKSVKSNKEIEHHDNIRQVRKHLTTQNVISAINLSNPDHEYFNASEPFRFKKDIDFYFTHY